MEFIPNTPEQDTSAERYSWDEIIRALDTLSSYDGELDLHEALQDLKDETLEDGYTMVFNYAVMIMSADESEELTAVMTMLEENGMMEGWGSDEV